MKTDSFGKLLVKTLLIMLKRETDRQNIWMFYDATTPNFKGIPDNRPVWIFVDFVQLFLENRIYFKHLFTLKPN